MSRRKTTSGEWNGLNVREVDIWLIGIGRPIRFSYGKFGRSKSILVRKIEFAPTSACLIRNLPHISRMIVRRSNRSILIVVGRKIGRMGQSVKLWKETPLCTLNRVCLPCGLPTAGQDLPHKAPFVGEVDWGVSAKGHWGGDFWEEVTYSDVLKL